MTSGMGGSLSHTSGLSLLLAAWAIEADSQHRDLAALVSQLNLRASSGLSPEQLRSMLADTHRLVYYHFSAERRLMNAPGYRERARHLADHDALKATLDVYLLRAETDSIGPTELLSFLGMLSGWLATHSAEFDGPLLSHVAAASSPRRTSGLFRSSNRASGGVGTTGAFRAAR